MQFGWQFLASTSRKGLPLSGRAKIASPRGTANREITLSRTIRRQLNALVRFFEQTTGERVGEDFRIAFEKRRQIVLLAHGRRVRLTPGSRAHHLAMAAVARFRHRTDRPEATSSKTTELCSLCVSHAGIIFIEGIQ